MFVRAGERCAHCGSPTPLGGTCPDCGGKICTRSARLRDMALTGKIGPHWACPHTAPASPETMGPETATPGRVHAPEEVRAQAAA